MHKNCDSLCHGEQHQLKPNNFPFGSELEFLQEHLSAWLTLFTLKIYVAGRHLSLSNTIRRGLFGETIPSVSVLAWCQAAEDYLRSRVPSWDLALVLGVLQEAQCQPFRENADPQGGLPNSIDFAKESRRFAGPLSCLFLHRLCSR